MRVQEIFNLHAWFEANKRDFPWRKEPNPYHVFVSEIMLQQTRASVVIPYFERWIERFPTVQALAEANLDEVIKLWEGLGYYSRARNLHMAALQINREFGGKIPDSKEQLSQIRGLGPYTVGALLSFGFKKKAAAVDGNVTRVLARYFLVEENVGTARAKRRIQEFAETMLDLEKPWVTAEALIELGACLCTAAKPQCEECPLRSGCRALQTGKMEALPIKQAPKKTVLLHRAVFIVESEGFILVRKEKKGRVMADLYELPYFEKTDESIQLCLKKEWGLTGDMTKIQGTVKHSFTCHVATLYPYHVRLQEKKEISDFDWKRIEELHTIPFSSGHRKILQQRRFL
jgi:A/G-specific adenine glycosylase